jgi:basic amino acid/polyamine antiporter, APA family
VTAAPSNALETPASIPARRSGGLLRILGVGFGLAVILGNTIGAGILRTPGDVARLLPVPWLYMGVWIFGGLYALLGACSMAELGAMMPRSGGYYIFARRAFGEFPAFVVGWTDFLAQCGSTSAVAIVVGEYMGELFPLFKGDLLLGPLIVHKHTVTAAAVAVLVAIPQWSGIRTGSLVQNLTSAAKALAFILLIGAIFVLAPSVPTTMPSAIPVGAGLLTALILAMQAVIYTYDGWYGVIYFCEEVKQPGRDVPRAMFGGVFAIMALYVLVNLALLHALPLSKIAGDQMPAGTIATMIFGRYGDTMIRSLMVISMISAISAYHLMASRIPYAMATDGLLTRRAARVNLGGTPTTALLLSVAASVGFILTGSFEMVAAIMAFFFVADYAMAYAAVFVLRQREPEADRPFRAMGYPWSTGLALAGSMLFLMGAVWSDTRNSLYSLGVLAVSYPLYKLFGVGKSGAAVA